MAEVTTRRVQVRVSEELGDRIQVLGMRLGVTESALCAILIAVGLEHVKDTLPSVPQRIVDRLEKEAAIEAAAEVQAV